MRDIIKKIIRFVYELIEHKIAAINLEQYSSKQKTYDPKVRVIQWKHEDHELVSVLFGEVTASKFKERNEKSTGYLIYSDNSMVGYYWGSSTPVLNEGKDPFRFDVIPPEKTVYLYDGFILKHKRSFGLMESALDILFKKLRKEGVKKAFLLFDKKNKAMIRLSQKIGIPVVGFIRYRRILDRSIRDLSGLHKICESK